MGNRNNSASASQDPIRLLVSKSKGIFCLLLRQYQRLLALFPALISVYLLCLLPFSHLSSTFLPFLFSLPHPPFLYHLSISVYYAELSNFPYSCALKG